jgi:hypothetical protein
MRLLLATPDGKGVGLPSPARVRVCAPQTGMTDIVLNKAAKLEEVGWAEYKA